MTSRGAKPVPPVESTTSATSSSHRRARHGGDLVVLVGQDTAPDDVVTRRGRKRGQHLARTILARPVVHAVGHREHGKPHGRTQWPDLPPSFSSSATDSICPVASMPFVMS